MTLDLGPFFNRYADRYIAADAQAIATMSEVPFLAVRSGVAIHLPDRQSLVEHLAHNMAGYRSSGAASADIVDIDVQEQGNEAVMATVHWNVRTADGTMVRDFRTSYQLVIADPWRILSYVNHDQVAHVDPIRPR